MEHTLKEAGFTDQQIQVLLPILGKTQTTPINEKSLALRIGAIEGKLAMLTWAVTFFVVTFMGFSGLFYQKTFSDIGNLQKEVQDIRKDVQEVKVVQTVMQKDIGVMQENIAVMQKDIQDLKSDIKDIKALLEKN